MITVVPTGTLLAGHCCVPLEPSRDGHQWVPLAHTGSYWDPLRLWAPHCIPGLLPPLPTMLIHVNTPHHCVNVLVPGYFLSTIIVWPLILQHEVNICNVCSYPVLAATSPHLGHHVICWWGSTSVYARIVIIACTQYQRVGHLQYVSNGLIVFDCIR